MTVEACRDNPSLADLQGSQLIRLATIAYSINDRVQSTVLFRRANTYMASLYKRA